MLEDDVIYYTEIINFFLRNKIIISLSSLILFIAGCIYALSIKPKWQGSFQIVFSEEKKATKGLIKGLNKDIWTELEKIKSPSVLMPVFFYAKEYQDKNSNLNFKFINFYFMEIL